MSDLLALFHQISSGSWTGSVQWFLEPWWYLANQPAFPPVMCGTMVMKDASWTEGVAQCTLILESDTPTDVITVRKEILLVILVPAGNQLFGFWTKWLLVEMVWTVQNEVREPERNPFRVGGKGLSVWFWFWAMLAWFDYEWSCRGLILSDVFVFWFWVILAWFDYERCWHVLWFWVILAWCWCGLIMSNHEWCDSEWSLEWFWRGLIMSDVGVFWFWVILAWFDEWCWCGSDSWVNLLCSDSEWSWHGLMSDVGVFWFWMILAWFDYEWSWRGLITEWYWLYDVGVVWLWVVLVWFDSE